MVTALLGLSSYFGNRTTQLLAVFVYNMSPFVAHLSYWLEFSAQLRRLPKKKGALLDDRHFGFLLRQKQRSRHSIPKSKKNT
jgi:hypothetical protein